MAAACLRRVTHVYSPAAGIRVSWCTSYYGSLFLGLAYFRILARPHAVCASHQEPVICRRLRRSARVGAGDSCFRVAYSIW